MPIQRLCKTRRQIKVEDRSSMLLSFLSLEQGGESMKQEFYYPSKDGMTQIHATEWKPEGEIKGILQICHGMIEHAGRYHDFAEFLSSNGYYVVGHDHLGHGMSVTGPENRGFFQEENGNMCLISDIHYLRVLTEQKYPNVPYFIMGHSMGSFLVRQYLGIYGRGLAGAVIMGTGDQPIWLLQAGKLVCKLISLFKGWKYRSKLVNDMSIGSYEKVYAHLTDGTSWLCKDPEIVKAYHSDPMGGFVFTISAYYHMYDGMLKMKKQEAEGKIPKNLPVYFVAGADDPVGNSGKAVEKVYQEYKKCGLKNVSIRLYENDRHEILNELDREVVYEDILAWLENRN